MDPTSASPSESPDEGVPPPAPCPSYQARAQELHCRYDAGLDEGSWRDLEGFARSDVLEREEVEHEVWDHFLELAGDATQAGDWIPQGVVEGRYRLRRHLGSGGFGQVWEAWDDSDLQRSIAIKFISSKEIAEAAHQAFGGRPHPNICPIHDRVRLGSHTALIMQLLSGGTLAERLEGGPLSCDRAVAITRQLAEALAFMHEREVLHLDIKPANVLFAEKTQQDHPFLCDFGVAASQGLHGRRGTPPYMAPEALRGEELTSAADVWSLGVVLYQLLTGQLPFGYEWTSDAQRPSDPQGIENTIPGLSELCLGMLEADQKSRPAMDVVHEALQQLPTKAEVDKREQVASYAESSERSRLHELKRSVVERPEHAELRERVQDLLGEGGLMLIEGEAGSGKTHTAAWLSQDAEGWDSKPIVIYGEARHCDRRPQGLLRRCQHAITGEIGRAPRYFEFEDDAALQRAAADGQRDSIKTIGRRAHHERKRQLRPEIGRRHAAKRRSPEVQLQQAWLAEMRAARKEGRPVLLVLDGMDELGASGRGLDFLPDPAEIPEGVALVVTSRERNDLEGSLVERGERFRLGLLDETRTRGLVKSVTGAELERDQLGRWQEATQGNPSVVVANAKAWKEGGQRADYEPQGGKGIFKEAHKRWHEIDASELLGLLVVMQPAGKIPLAMAEAGLRFSRGADIALQTIERVQDELGDQISLEGEGERRALSLRREDYAQWVAEENWRPRTLEAQLRSAADLLADAEVLEEIDLGVLARFVLHWDEAKPECGAVQQLLERLAEREAAEALIKVYVEEGPTKASRAVALEALELAAGAGSLGAMRILGNRLIDGWGLDQDPRRGAQALIRAAEGGHPAAQVRLSIRLLDGDGLPQDQGEGEKWLRKSVEGGDAENMRILGLRLLDGDGLPQNQEEGEKWLRKSAEGGDADAQAALGWRLLDGDGLPQDQEEGEKWLRKSVEGGDVEGMRILGVRLLDGDGLPQDQEEGEEWLRKSAEAGDTDAQAGLAIRLLDGDGLPRNQEEGEEWLRKSVEGGGAWKMLILGNRLLDGDGLSQNQEEAEEWLRRSAEAGDTDAQAILGIRLLDGNGLPQSQEEGEEWLRKSAEAGDAHAQANLGLRLLDGRSLPQNQEEGEEWLRKSVEGGDAENMRILGLRLLKGNGLPQDQEEGEKWLRKSAEAGDADAQANLGWRLLDGDGLPQDQEEGEKWLRKSVEGGDAENMRILGLRLLDGNGLPQSQEEGEEWLRKSAEGGDTNAQGTLGWRLLDGDGLAQDQEDGEKWLRKSVEGGDTDAQGELGIRLLDGNGLPQDQEEGAKWLRKSAEAGDADAMGFLASRLLFGAGLSEDNEQGLAWLRKGAEAGDSWAQRDLGLRLLDGNGLPQDPEEGEEWLRKSVEGGDAENMRILGLRLLDGNGLPQDQEEGEKWLRKSVEGGDAENMRILGVRLLDGNGLPQNQEEAEMWLRLAAEAGDASAQLFLGFHLLDGDVLPLSKDEGEQWLRKSAESGCTDAQAKLGLCILRGECLAQDPDEGERWLREPAAAGDTQSQFVLGQCLLNGDGLPQDLVEGETWLRASAEAGYTDAQLSLGDRLLNGAGLPQDQEEGEMWLRRSAEAGDVDAQVTLGIRLMEGYLVPQDRDDGERWLRRSAESGDIDAQAYLCVCLLQGDGLPQDQEEGDKWLRVVGEANDLTSLTALGRLLLTGRKGMRKSRKKALGILRLPAARGDAAALDLLRKDRNRRVAIGALLALAFTLLAALALGWN